MYDLRDILEPFYLRQEELESGQTFRARRNGGRIPTNTRISDYNNFRTYVSDQLKTIHASDRQCVLPCVRHRMNLRRLSTAEINRYQS